MSELEKTGGRDSRSLISMALDMCQENEILQARVKVLESENKRLRAELDWMREKFLEVEAMVWRDRPAARSANGAAVLGRTGDIRTDGQDAASPAE